jgi:hypothetical protein
MRNEIFRRIKGLGVFELDEKTRTKIGIGLHYKYYPRYMRDTHYTLVVFVTRFSRDYRLYIHNNCDGSYNDSLFQISDSTNWTIKYLHEEISNVFKVELRKNKLESIEGIK